MNENTAVLFVGIVIVVAISFSYWFYHLFKVLDEIKEMIRNQNENN